jgi:hypothetical protein
MLGRDIVKRKEKTIEAVSVILNALQKSDKLTEAVAIEVPHSDGMVWVSSPQAKTRQH